MQAIIAAILSGVVYLFKNRLGLFIMSAMVWLGINFATINLVVEPAIDTLEAYANGMKQGGTGLAAAAGAWIGVMQFDKALTMVISAFATVTLIRKGRLFLFKNGPGA